MIFTDIQNRLQEEKTDISEICQSINAYLSKNDPSRIFMPRSVFLKKYGPTHPSNEVLCVHLSKTGREKTGINGGVSYAVYETAKKVMARLYLMTEGDVIYGVNHIDGHTYKLGYLTDKEVIEPEWHLIATEVVDKTPKKTFSLTQEEAYNGIIKRMKELDVRMTSRYSTGGKLVESPSYTTCLTEYAVAAALTKMDVDGCWFPTHLRTKIPLPWGGVSSVREGKGMSQEDNLQLLGIDLMKMPYSMKERKQIYRNGPSLDVKLICSATLKGMESVPIEAWMEDRAKHIDDPARWIHNFENLWTWSPSHTADIVYVVGTKGYLIKKEVLRAIVESQKEGMELGRSNKKPWKNGLYKWNVYYPIELLEKKASRVFDLPQEYTDLLTEHAYTLFGLHADVRDEWTHNHLRIFNSMI